MAGLCKRMFHNPTLKKIVNVYQLHYKNKVAQGFGDYLRGCFCLLQVAHTLGVQFDMDLSNHPLSQFLETSTKKNPNIRYEEISWFENPNYIPLSHNTFRLNTQQFYPELVQRMNSVNIPVYPLFCNSFPISTAISQQDRAIIKSKLIPNDRMKRQMEETFRNLGIERRQYNVIHVRCGDEYLLKNDKIDIPRVQKIITHVAKHIRRNEKTLLLSDNNQIKIILKKQFPTLLSRLKPIVHLGESREFPENSILHTLVDFYLLSFSKNTTAFSPYTWGSGFSEWASIMNNVPYKKFFL